MRIESHHVPAPQVGAIHNRGPEPREETVQVPVPDPIEQNPALRAYFGESAFDPAADKIQAKAQAKVQAKEDAPQIDPALFGGWAGERLQLGLLIAEKLKQMNWG